jgi:hypothetical protein
MHPVGHGLVSRGHAEKLRESGRIHMVEGEGHIQHMRRVPLKAPPGAG